MNKHLFNLTQFLLDNYKDKNKIVYFSPDGNKNISEIKEQIHKLAKFLSGQKVLAGDRVVICLNDSTYLVAIFLASIAIGAIPIVVNPKLSGDKLQYILKDSGANLHFYQDDSEIHLCVYGNNYKLKSELEHIDSEEIKYFVTSWNNVAFIQYTSGTTGNPKGVMHSAANAIYSCQLFAQNCLRINSDDILYSTSKMFFGYGMGNSIFFPLYFGASAVLDSKWSKIEYVIENISWFAPTVLLGTSTIYSKLYDMNSELLNFEKIRFFFSAGATLPSQLVNKWMSKFNCRIYDGFGATEMCHVFITNITNDYKSNSIGKLVAGYDLRIVNKDGANVLKGESGTLFIKGPSTFLGYWNNINLTTNKLNSGWYRTGDIVSCDDDMDLYFLGREDDLFKVNGQFVNPNTIENRLKQNLPFLEEVFVVPTTDANGNTVPILYYLLSSNAPDNAKSHVIEEAKLNCEKYYHPVDYIQITQDNLPFNDNGKIVKHKLHNLLATKA